MIKVFIFGLLLLVMLTASGLRSIQAQEASESVLFRWGKNCTVTMVRDLTDWDMDKVTGEKYYVLTSINYDCPSDRDVSFDFKLKDDNFKRTTSIAKEVKAPFGVPLWITRVTEENFSWNFTPAHVDVVKGSVSAPSLLTAGGDAVIDADDVTAAFTPTANSLLLIAFSSRRVTGLATFTFTNSHTGSGAWSSVEVTDTTNDDVRHAQARSQTGASPGSGTITNTYGGTQPNRVSWVVAEVTGHDTTTPLSESNTGGAGSGTTLAISLAAVAAGNMAVSSIGVVNQTGITLGAGETELSEADSTGSPNQMTQMQYSTNAAHDWAWTNSEENVGVVIEYAQAAGAVAAQVIMVD